MSIKVDLLSYLPPFIQEYNEIQRIMNAESPEFQILWGMDENIRKQLYVTTATDQGLRRFEKMLGIFPTSDDSLESRRTQVLMLWNDVAPYTVKALKNLLEITCGADRFSINVKHDEYMLQIKLSNVSNNTYLSVYSMLHRIVPANMIIDMLVQHDLPIAYIDVYNRKGKVAIFHKIVLDWDLFIQTDTEAQIGITPVIQVYQRTVIN